MLKRRMWLPRSPWVAAEMSCGLEAQHARKTFCISKAGIGFGFYHEKKYTSSGKGFVLSCRCVCLWSPVLLIFRTGIHDIPSRLLRYTRSNMPLNSHDLLHVWDALDSVPLYHRTGCSYRFHVDIPWTASNRSYVKNMPHKVRLHRQPNVKRLPLGTNIFVWLSGNLHVSPYFNGE